MCFVIGVVQTIAGGEGKGCRDEIGSNAAFRWCSALLVSPDGARIWVADARNHRIRQIHTVTRSVSTVAGCGEPEDTDGAALQSALNFPHSLAFDESSKPDFRVYIATARSVRCLSFAIGMCCVVHFLSYTYALSNVCDSDARHIYQVLEASGALQSSWLLPELWFVVAQYCARLTDGTRPL
jgi:hypothetical protein